MLVVQQGRTLFEIPREQFYPPYWQTGVALPTRDIQPQHSSGVNQIVDALGKIVVGGLAVAGLFAGCELLFGSEKRVMHCSECGREGHTARYCPLTGQRTRLRIIKTGGCKCCGGSFKSTELHHYAGRGEDRGKEMCAPCHLHCGHGGDWFNFPINPRYCRLAA
jgi:hypothetical protein